MGDETKKKFEGTQVDLGEDLLEATRAIVRSREGKAGKTSATKTRGAGKAVGDDSPDFNVQEEIQRGEIFFNERLFDDAKKVFRKVLRSDPNNSTAKQFLDEIQRSEIQDLLGGEAPRKRLGSNTATDDDDPQIVLEKLEKELRISVSKSELRPVPDLFRDEAELARYKRQVLEVADSLPPKDRMDVGIAHLEMGFYDIAQSIFESVIHADSAKHTGMYLLGLSLIYGGKAIEATIRLEPLCRDLTLVEGPKTDFLYLMGLAFEHLNDQRKAREFYRRVFTLNPRYRDVVDKLK